MFGLTKRLAMLLLSIWLIVSGLFSVADVGFQDASLILDLLAMAAGGVILLQWDSWSAKMGMILLGAWLVAQGLVGLLPMTIQGVDMILGLAALAAGILILLKR